MTIRLLFSALVLGFYSNVLILTGSAPLHRNRRMIGGQAVYDQCKEPFSWMAALRFDTKGSGPVTYCSAVIVSEKVLVTAGRCLHQFQKPMGVAIVGERDLELIDPGEHIMEIDSFKIHSAYNKDTYDNNIALIRLKTPIKMSNCAKVSRRTEDDPEACKDLDTSCTMVGWGPYNEPTDAANSRLPRSARLQVYDDVVSNMISINDIGKQPPAGSRLGDALIRGVKACRFDWGGLVACRRNRKFVLRGLIGDHNCNYVQTQATPPVIITDIPAYQIWIDSCVADWSSCSSL